MATDDFVAGDYSWVFRELADERLECGKPAPRSAYCEDREMDVLASRIILRPSDREASQRFYRDTLGLAVFREFGPPQSPGVVFFAGQGLIEVSGESTGTASAATAIWLQVRDVAVEHQRLLAAGVEILREPRLEFWGLIELWIADPDGNRLVLVEVPDGHPLRRDNR
jgi:catechol 2,3-dioxygenase-like lactoylglutathione lyase family enzyme